MGKGRNNRHRKRRREQSNKAKKEQKKEKKAMPAKMRHPKPKRKKNKRKNKMSWRNVQYIKLGMSGGFLIEPKYSEYIDTLREWLEEGKLTDITFLAFGKWNSRTRKRLWGILKENNNEWAWNHLVFKLPHEFETAFILRTVRCFSMSHYVDTDKNHIQPIVMSYLYKSVKLFRWHDDVARGWDEMKTWIKRHNPAYYSLYELGQQADFIIQTGVMAKPEPEQEETHVHQHNYDDYNNDEWFGL